MIGRIVTGVCLVACCTFAGCGNPGPEIAQVSGVVSVNGKPQRGLLVRFLPEPSGGEQVYLYASGVSDEQGRYELSHLNQGREIKGAPVGSHQIVIEDTTRPQTPQGQQPPPPLIPLAYGSPATTPLRREVVSGEQTINLDVRR